MEKTVIQLDLSPPAGNTEQKTLRLEGESHYSKKRATFRTLICAFKCLVR